MKCLVGRFAVPLLVAGLATCAAGADKVLCRMDFDAQIPGARPEGWASRGGQVDGIALRYVNSHRAVSRPNSMLLDYSAYAPSSRASAGQQHGYYIFRPEGLEQHDPAKRLALSMAFRRETDGFMTLEIRSPEVDFCVQFKRRLAICEKFTPLPVLGFAEEGLWYRLVIWFPKMVDGKSDALRCRLDSLGDDGRFVPGEIHSFPGLDGLKGNRITQIAFCGMGRAKLYVDDLVFFETDD